ncbi:MAG: chorismate mutase [Hyphomicrobiaceae bacterium]|nr:chorismate mutase [Hyphomicrobiaceae bacterium]
MAETAPRSLAEIREEIDRIDAEMHRLLMERGSVIDDLIAIKKTAEGHASAFRPAREASMMGAMMARHQGLLPADTVESIWRIIISTFTYVQAPYSVHIDTAPGADHARDTGRFHFGFTVPLVMEESAAEVVAAILASPGDLGLVCVSAAGRGAWWADLVEASGPKIIAALPFVDRPDHPAATPYFVVAAPVGDAAANDILLVSIDYDGSGDDRDSAEARFAAIGWCLVDFHRDGAGTRALVSLVGVPDEDALTLKAREAVPHLQALALVGGHARAYASAPTGEDAA